MGFPNRTTYILNSFISVKEQLQKEGVRETDLNMGCCCSVAKFCPTLCDPMHCRMPDFPVFHYLFEFAQTHVHWVSDVI